MTIVDARRLTEMHALYRMFDERDRLLYIGMTGDFGKRLGEHSVKRWFPLVERITLEWLPNKAAARVAERRAIGTERPRYNIAGTRPPKKPKPVAPEPGDLLRDILTVFGSSRGLHWVVLVDRLAVTFPAHYSDLTPEAVSAQCRALGVPSICVRYPTSHEKGTVRRGCRRADVKQAAAKVVTGQL
jgi:hypothetical protein